MLEVLLCNGSVTFVEMPECVWVSCVYLTCVKKGTVHAEESMQLV